ncbi:hypothetical protein, partial [Legionella geestiana]|uniref:hypothetical protein n=1 Tax=Legionella geestiana TaxID=45065 RepID=UPI001EE74791
MIAIKDVSVVFMHLSYLGDKKGGKSVFFGGFLPDFTARPVKTHKHQKAMYGTKNRCLPRAHAGVSPVPAHGWVP